MGRQMRPGRSAPQPSAVTLAGERAGETAVPPGVDVSPQALLSRVFEKLRTGGLASGELDWLRRRLLAAEPGEALAAIAAFLATGQDARTGENFEIGRGGELSGAPTFRVALLDIFGQICRNTGGSEAATFSRSLLERKTSADEWAVALRNIAWSTPGERSYLAGKVREMLAYQPWRQQPSSGFLEAFDIVVFSRDVTLIPELGDMVAGEDEATKRAAAVALDRFSEMAPLDVMMYLNANPEEFAERPLLRADYFSRADLSQAAQRVAVETYLSRADVAAAEKAKLLATFASPGSFVGDTLVTEPPSGDLEPQRVAGLQNAVNDWLRTNRFPGLSAPLVNLRERLSE
jgi:hypothetical protein